MYAQSCPPHWPPTLEGRADNLAQHCRSISVSVTRLSCFVDSLGPILLLTCYHGWRFCRTDIVEDHKRLITINNYFSQDWNDFNFAVRISSLRFSFGRDWNDKFQLRCSNDKFGRVVKTFNLSLKGIYPEFQVIRGFSQKIPAGLLCPTSKSIAN